MKKIGIIGGMGPLATADLFQKIILATTAHSDQENIPILIDNNTAIPDRTAAILGTGKSPVPEIMCSVHRLTEQGADVLIMGCNTAHYFLPWILPQLKLPFINMIEETVAFCKNSRLKKVGLLASEGTYAGEIYHQELKKQSIDLVEPSNEQKKIMQDIIYAGVKAGNTKYETTPFKQVLKEMRSRGAEAFILGCTEIPVAVNMYQIEEKFIDATQVLAASAVRFAEEKEAILAFS